MLTLFFVDLFGAIFILIYLLCGASDILDGYIARKTNTVSAIGARIDSLADMIMFIAVFILIYPMIVLPLKIVVFILVILTIRLISMVIGYIKYRKIGVIHTYSNKLTGFIVFIYPLLLPFDLNQGGLLYLICLIASISAIEELLIHITSKELNLNKKTIFHG